MMIPKECVVDRGGNERPSKTKQTCYDTSFYTYRWQPGMRLPPWLNAATPSAQSCADLSSVFSAFPADMGFRSKTAQNGANTCGLRLG